MKAPRVSTMLFATVLLGLSANTLRAEEVARVTVPFPFVVNGKTLPSGQYLVRTDDDDPAIMMIDGVKNTKAHAMVVTLPDYKGVPAGNKPALTFVREGTQYRLSTVWETNDYGRDLVVR